MGSTTHGERLRGLIGRKLDTGGLPTNAPLRLDVHHGTGAICDGCNKYIRTVEIAHELLYPNGLSLRLTSTAPAIG